MALASAPFPGPAAALSGLVVVPQGYHLAVTPPLNLGVGGLPRANPIMRNWGENLIRHPYMGCDCCCSCCMPKWQPGPNVPWHWYDGEEGWSTFYFTDVEPFSWEQKKNGKFRCQVPGCAYTVDNDGCCNDTPCWCPFRTTSAKMTTHVMTHHGAVAPPKRQWSTEFCDCRGCCDATLCTPCNGARQMDAMSGYANSMNKWWCLAFFCAGCDGDFNAENFCSLLCCLCSDDSSVGYYPPCTTVALWTRWNLVELNNIDESWCSTLMKVWCCPLCSVMQTHRELTASGVWPGPMIGFSDPMPGLAPVAPPHRPVAQHLVQTIGAVIGAPPKMF